MSILFSISPSNSQSICLATHPPTHLPIIRLLIHFTANIYEWE